jgi:hypothetical protein
VSNRWKVGGWVVLVLCGLAACGSPAASPDAPDGPEAPPGQDAAAPAHDRPGIVDLRTDDRAGLDAAPDLAADAAIDARDAPTDAPADAGIDAPADVATADAPADAATDAPADAAADASPDAVDLPADADAAADAPPRVPELHRPTPEVCPGTRPPSGGCDSVDPPSDECHADSDCMQGGRDGRCLPYSFYSTCICVYDGCYQDSECAAGHVCQCQDDGNYCISAECAVDADCGPAGFCSRPIIEPGCGISGAYGGWSCHTAADSCLDNSDCNPGSYCVKVIATGRWECRQLSFCA